MGSGDASVATIGSAVLPDADLQPRIEDERAATLYGKGAFPYLANVMIGAIEVVAVSGVVPAERRFGWLALISAVTLIRLAVWWLYRQARYLFEARQWLYAFTVGGTINGLAWGSTAWFLWGPGVDHHALLGFVVGGMVAGSTAVVPSYLPAFYTFAAAALVPMGARLLAEGGTVDTTMGILLLFFGLNMTRLARGAGRWFTENTELRLQNALLVEHLSAARDELEGRVLARTAELERTVAQLREAELRAREALRMRNDFLAIASHELRTPLSTLELQVARFEWHLAQPDPVNRPELNDSVQAVRRQVRRLTGLVDTVLTASGLVRQGGLVLEPVELDLAAIVRGVVADARAAPATRGTPVTLALVEPVMGSWDPVRVEEVIANLVSNAMRFGAGKPVRIALAASEDQAILEINDQGPGIRAEERARIFERFVSVDAGGRAAGLGLGLSVVHDLVELMRGAVTVESEPGRGTTFTLRLPRRPRVE
jgi:signal transduction histidine kinase